MAQLTEWIPTCADQTMKSEYQLWEQQGVPTPTEIPLEQLPTVDFNERGYRVAKHIAAARTLTYESGEEGEAYGNQSHFSAHLTGILGEIAVARSLGGCFDDGVYIYGDDGYDVRIAGDTIDVKTTETDLRLPDLIVKADPEPTADYYVLCHRIEKSTIRIIGFADQDTVLKQDPQQFPGSQLNYIVSTERLRAFQE